MQRDLGRLTAERFDVLVIGGGAFGAAAAWDATLRGLKVALVEQADFGAGASAECFKMVHGGIRYLQHGDVRRLRHSCAERSALLRIAPHLVNPLPIVIPTYGHGRSGKAFLAAGMLAYDLLTLDKNRGIRDRQRQISSLELMSKRRVLELFPELQQDGLTGAAVFEDGQMYNTARVVLAYVKSAAARGAAVANYLRATGFIWEGRQVVGIQATDELTGQSLDLKARLVLNAAGPWADYLIQDPPRFAGHTRGHFSRDACFIVNRRPSSKDALAVPGWSKDSDALVSRAARHLFAVPWRNHTLIGVWHKLWPTRPDTAQVAEAELEAWIREMNDSYPVLRLRREDVLYANCGLVPFGDESSATGELSFGKESRYHNHAEQGIKGLVTLIGIRFTTSRGDAARALDLLLQQLPDAPAAAPTDRTPLQGGDFDNVEQLRVRAQGAVGNRVSQATLQAWLRNYGTEYEALSRLAETPAEAARLAGSDTVVAEVSHAVKNEMALRLQDVVMRRTDLGSGSHPTLEALQQAAAVMQRLSGWSETRLRDELDDTREVLRRHLASPPADSASQPGTAAA